MGLVVVASLRDQRQPTSIPGSNFRLLELEAARSFASGLAGCGLVDFAAVGMLCLALLLARGSDPIAVLDLKALGVPREVAELLSNALVARIRERVKPISVVGSEDIQRLVGFADQKRKLGCDDAKCLADIGGSLGAGKIVVGTVGKLGKSYRLDLRLIKVGDASMIGQAGEEIKGVEEDALLDALSRCVDRLFPGADASPRMSGNPNAGSVGTVATPAGSHRRFLLRRSGHAKNRKACDDGDGQACTRPRRHVPENGQGVREGRRPSGWRSSIERPATAATRPRLHESRRECTQAVGESRRITSKPPRLTARAAREVTP